MVENRYIATGTPTSTSSGKFEGVKKRMANEMRTAVLMVH
jgi:hypothetical protein